MIVMSLDDRTGRIRHDSATPVTVQVAADIEADIDAGRLAPDTRLPSEAELAAQYGVARVTVRRAIAQLRDRGRSSPCRAGAPTSSRILVARRRAGRTAYSWQAESRQSGEQGCRKAATRQADNALTRQRRPGGTRPAGRLRDWATCRHDARVQSIRAFC